MIAFFLVLAFVVDYAVAKPVHLADRQNRVIDILYQITGFEGPYTLTCLKQRNNEPFIYKVDYADKSYVVRFSENDDMQQCINEVALHHYAEQYEFGPHILYADENEGVVVMEYLTGQPFEEILDKNQTDLLVALVKKIHASTLPCRFQMSFVTDVLNRFSQRLERNCFGLNLLPFYESLKFLKHCIDATVKPVFVHGDLHEQNVFFCQDSWKAIDFEAAHYDHPYVDLSCLALDFCPNKASELYILEQYLNRPVNNHDWVQFTIFRLFNVASFVLWMFELLGDDFMDASECSEIFYVKPLAQFLHDPMSNAAQSPVWRYRAIIAGLKEAEYLLAFLHTSFATDGE